MNTVELTEEETAIIWAALDSWVADISKYDIVQDDAGDQAEAERNNETVKALAERFKQLPGVALTA